MAAGQFAPKVEEKWLIAKSRTRWIPHGDDREMAVMAGRVDARIVVVKGIAPEDDRIKSDQGSEQKHKTDSTGSDCPEEADQSLGLMGLWLHTSVLPVRTFPPQRVIFVGLGQVGIVERVGDDVALPLRLKSLYLLEAGVPVLIPLGKGFVVV